MPKWTFTNHTAIEFLLCALSPNTDSDTIGQVRSLAKEIDWQAVVQLAKKHRVLPSLYHRINDLCADEVVPANIQEELRQHCQSIAIRNLSMTAELCKLLSLMAASDVDAMPYKGSIVTQTLYGDLSARQFGDIDIVIQPQDMLRVEQLLIDQGYRPYFGKKNKADLADYMAAKNEHTYDFYHDQKKFFVEIHWRFWPVFFSTVSPRDIWHRRESTKLANTKVSNLKLEDTLVILCMHGSRHQWERLSWLRDIAMLIDKYPELDWEEAIATAQQWGAKRMLYLGLYLARTWLGAELPASVLKKVEVEPAIMHLADQVDSTVFGLEPSDRPLAATRYQIKARERWQDKAVCAQSFIHWLLRGRPSEHHSL